MSQTVRTDRGRVSIHDHTGRLRHQGNWRVGTVWIGVVVRRGGELEDAGVEGYAGGLAVLGQVCAAHHPGKKREVNKCSDLSRSGK